MGGLWFGRDREPLSLWWNLKYQTGSEYFGLQTCTRRLSAVHVKMEGLIWAALCMRNMRITSIRFETDCLDLVDMTTNLTDWPSFATEIEMFQTLHENLEDVSMSHIPRNRNGRADALAKEVRIRGYTFPI